MYQAEKSRLYKLLTVLSTALLAALAIFILAFTVKVGCDLVKVFKPIPVEAAAEESTVQPTASPATSTPAVEETPLPPAFTPLAESTEVPTSTPAPTSTPMPTPTVTPTIEETPVPVRAQDEDRWIDVDLSEQRLTAYEMQTPVKSYLVSTGLPQTPTPVGQFRIWIKLRTDDMAGADYYIKDVPWVMYFFEGYGLHGVTWHANFGTQMSHGCVNQPNDMAEWLFNFASVGTLVNIHE